MILWYPMIQREFQLELWTRKLLKSLYNTTLHYGKVSMGGATFRILNFASHFIRVQIFQIDFPLIISASKYFRQISLSFYICRGQNEQPAISQIYLLGDEMNSSKTYTLENFSIERHLFHSRKTKTKRRYGKWKWNYKSDIWPPCSIKKREVKYLLNNFSE